MLDTVLVVELATEADIQGVLDLQDKNQPDRGGSLTGRFNHEQLIALLLGMPIIVAKRGGSVVGYLITSEIKVAGRAPVIKAMLGACTAGPATYVYGPVCVSNEHRGKGIAQKLFTEAKRQLAGRDGLLFIREDNTASIQAHKKMGMLEVGAFRFNESPFLIFSC